MLMAVAVASGRWNSDTRNTSVANASITARAATQPVTSRRGCSVAPPRRTATSTKAVASTPRRKMSCPVGMLSLASFTNVSFSVNANMASTIRRMLRRVARAASSGRLSGVMGMGGAGTLNEA